ncbi:MAG: hypothetical protein SNI51_03990 [Rikenellaceae bacterium]
MVLSIISLLFVVAIGVAMQQRGERNCEQLRQHYLRLLLLGRGSGERYLDDLSHLSGSRAKRVAAEVVAHITPVIYRIDEEPLLHLNRTLRLSEYLLIEARGARGARRAQILSLLSLLPTDTLTKLHIKPFRCDENRMVRFFAMVTMINIDKDNLLHHVASFDSPLTPFELSYLVGLLRQGAIVVAYQPMLGSFSVNLNMLGLAVVRQFGVEDAEEMLCQIVERRESYHLRREALYTLASLQLSLDRFSLVTFVRSMSHDESQRFLRYVATMGYAQSVIDIFVSKYARPYFHSLINSYKIKIECS